MQANIIIRDILQKENLNLTQLANMLGVSVASLSNKLNRPTMKYSDVLEILHILGYELIPRKIENNIVKEDSVSNHYMDYIESTIHKTLSSMLIQNISQDIKNEISEEIGISIEDIKKKLKI